MDRKKTDTQKYALNCEDWRKFNQRIGYLLV